jgi:protocatechuate 3,4-dioxygenase alpha subunit
VHIGLAPKQAGFDIFENNFGNVLVTSETRGERIDIEGRVYDGSGSLVRDVLIEIWQANAAGRYAHPADRQDLPIDPSFRGWGRTGADFETGVYRFETIKPGAVLGRNGTRQAPHILLVLFARGSECARLTCALCADACELCGDECARYSVEHCRACAAACRRCAEECRQMARPRAA